MRSTDGGKLRSVQIMRGAAAFAVVLAHVVTVERKYLPGSPITGHAMEICASGVDLFFVISGFIITTTTAGRPRRKGDSLRFLYRRFSRIYPLYWVYCACLLPLFLVDPEMVNQSHGRPDLVTSFLLLPDRNLPLLIVAWTLSFELYFYLVYAAVLRFLDDRRSAAALIVWGMLVAAGNLVLQPGESWPVLHLLFSPLNLEFIAGCFVARIADRIGGIAAPCCLAAGTVVLCLGGGAVGAQPLVLPELAWTRMLVYGTAYTLILTGAIGWERVARHVPNLFVSIGDASYSLYLSHVLTIGAIGWLWHRLLAGPGAMDHLAMLILAVAVALLWSLISFACLERPLLAVTRRILLLMSPRHAAMHGA